MGEGERDEVWIAGMRQHQRSGIDDEGRPILERVDLMEAGVSKNHGSGFGAGE